jgi:hypothetical protein
MAVRLLPKAGAIDGRDRLLVAWHLEENLLKNLKNRIWVDARHVLYEDLFGDLNRALESCRNRR